MRYDRYCVSDETRLLEFDNHRLPDFSHTVTTADTHHIIRAFRTLENIGSVDLVGLKICKYQPVSNVYKEESFVLL